MSQSKTMSLLETVTNQVTGFFVALGVYHFIIPAVFGIQTTVAESSSVVIIFTTVSVIRSYLVRRLFVKLHNKGY